MFGLDSHWGFVFVSYAISALVLIGLSVFVVVDFRRQKRQLSVLEATGARRRSRASKEN